MRPQTSKLVMAILPVSKTNGATAGGEIVDTKGAKHVTFNIAASLADVVSNTPNVMKLQEADVTAATSFADVSGFVGGTDFVIGNSYTATANGQNLWKLEVNLNNSVRKRYLRLQVSPQTTMVIAATADLKMMETQPTNAAAAGVLALVGA